MSLFTDTSRGESDAAARKSRRFILRRPMEAALLCAAVIAAYGVILYGLYIRLNAWWTMGWYHLVLCGAFPFLISRVFLEGDAPARAGRWSRADWDALAVSTSLTLWATFIPLVMAYCRTLDAWLLRLTPASGNPLEEIRILDPTAITAKLAYLGLGGTKGLLFLPYFFLVNGATEEFFWRGFVQSRLEKFFGEIGAVGLSGLLYGGYHYFVLRIFLSPGIAIAASFGVFLFGIAMGILWMRRRRLVIPMAAHIFGADLAVCLACYFFIFRR